VKGQARWTAVCLPMLARLGMVLRAALAGFAEW
jgi:hypothetical protein